MAARIPVHVVTGFLGSGKTTLLAALLADPRLTDTAVIVNELGEVGLDHHLVREVANEVVLLGSGCLCCAVREDLVATLDELARRADAGEIPRFRRAAVETTGLADPAPIVHALLTEGAVRERYALHGLLATVDAVHGVATLARQPEAVKQVALADRLVLTKTDLAPDTAALEARIAALNPSAEVLRSAPGRMPGVDALTGLPSYDPGTAGEDALGWLGIDSRRRAFIDVASRPPSHPVSARLAPSAAHDPEVACFTVRRTAPLRWASFVEWLELFLDARGDQMLRMKGLLRVEGRERPLVLHAVQHLVYPPAELGAWPEGRAETALVFVVRGLTRAAIERSLASVIGA